MLKGKKIVLGITGSIAAYKACYIIRGLIKAGAEVQVVITPAGKEFITPITLSALTQKPVISDFFSQRDGSWHSHVALGLWADAMLIAPCTASTLGKMANGVADNMLITTYLSMKAPVFIAPAMDLDMYQHPTTQENLQKLQSFGNQIIEPQSGFLASGLEGKGRMEEPEKIVEYLDRALDASAPLAGKKIMITAGPTYEKIDPVRFIGNSICHLSQRRGGTRSNQHRISPQAKGNMGMPRTIALRKEVADNRLLSQCRKRDRCDKLFPCRSNDNLYFCPCFDKPTDDIACFISRYGASNT